MSYYRSGRVSIRSAKPNPNGKRKELKACEGVDEISNDVSLVQGTVLHGIGYPVFGGNCANKYVVLAGVKYPGTPTTNVAIVLRLPRDPYNPEVLTAAGKLRSSFAPQIGREIRYSTWTHRTYMHIAPQEQEEEEEE